MELPDNENIFVIAKELFPGATEDEISNLVWERSCFPFDNLEAIKQLEDLANFWKRILGVE